MTGKLKTKGNMMLATKLDAVLKVCLPSVDFRGRVLIWYF
jgi:putative sterol carrier protein